MSDQAASNRADPAVVPESVGDERNLLVGSEGINRGGRERADAARNRQRVLDAAQRLFSEREPASVTMGDIASAAGVGRATLYRRFPDTASVAIALLDSHERELQQRMISGPPPLGPGASPGERLAAFYTSMVALLDEHLPLALGAESGASRFTTGAYGIWRLHVRSLLEAADIADPDAHVDALLAPLDPETFRYQRHHLGLAAGRIAHALATQAYRILEPIAANDTETLTRRVPTSKPSRDDNPGRRRPPRQGLRE
ncbi:MAG TPA: TetR/AcrR family transcriptional regulator [Nocardioidaceae bacterium]|nr:TetR/AcrR family transcriptional regulator [Nocardioidaceae bacterium]